jgi:hypothetical protein
MIFSSITLVNIGVATQVVTAIFAALYFYKYKNSSLNILLPFFIYLCLNEYFGMWYSNHINTNNSVVYNLYNIIEITVFITVYKNSLQTIRAKQNLSVLLLVYYFAVIINCFFATFTNEVFTNAYLLGTVFIIYAIVLYFGEILGSDKIIFINKSLLFWISTGLLISYVPNIPFSVVIKYYLNSPTIPYIYDLMFLITILTNLLFIIGFICSNKETKR